MVQRTLSPAALASANASETGEVWLVCLTIKHPTLVNPIRLVNDFQDMGRNDGTGPLWFIGLPFAIELPGEDAENATTAKLKVDNIDRQITASIRAMVEPPLCDIEVVLASQPDIVEVGLYDFTLRTGNWDMNYVEGSLQIEQIFQEPVSLTMTPQRFPGAF